MTLTQFLAWKFPYAVGAAIKKFFFKLERLSREGSGESGSGTSDEKEVVEIS